MARIVVDRIQLPSSTVPGEKPPATLKHGELWINTADKKIYAGVDGGTPIVIDAATGSTIPASITNAIKTLTADDAAAKAKIAALEALTKSMGGAASATNADLAKLKALLKPVIDHGFHAAGGVPSAGGVPTLDAVGQIPPSMIGGTDKQPARAGEVPKFKPNGKLDPGLIDYNFASISSPSSGAHTPTAADSGKLVRLDVQGKLDTSLLGLDPLNYKGEMAIGPAGATLTGEVLNGAGTGGTIWIVAAAAGKTYDVNFDTGAVADNTGSTPAGSLDLKTGDLLVKSNDKKIHRINADLIPTAHLLPRDGSRAMIGDLVFQARGTSPTHEIKGAQKVSASEGHFHKLVAEMLPGTPGVANGEIEDFLIDGEKNVIRFRHGPDPTVGRVDGKKGEVYIDGTGGVVRVFFCTADGPNWLEGISTLVVKSIDLTSEAKGPTDTVADAFGNLEAGLTPAERKLKEDVIFFANFSEKGVETTYACFKRGGSTDIDDWMQLGILDIPFATAAEVGVVKPDGSTLVVDASGEMSLSMAMTGVIAQNTTDLNTLKADLTKLQSDFAALKADYDAYKVAHP